MKTILVRTTFFCALSLLLLTNVNAQSGPSVEEVGNTKRKVASLTRTEDKGNPVLRLAGQMTVIVVKSAAKTAWATTKFAAKDVAKPILVGIAKPLLLKATPQITLFALKLTGKSLQQGIPIATKLGMTYLRAKLPF